MATVVRMPAALAGATEGAIQTWLAEVGQSIAVGEPLAEIETEKAVVEYASEVEGTVGRLLAKPGDNIEVGAPIAVILAAGEGDAQADAALEGAGVAAPSGSGSREPGPSGSGSPEPGPSGSGSPELSQAGSPERELSPAGSPEPGPSGSGSPERGSPAPSISAAPSALEPETAPTQPSSETVTASSEPVAARSASAGARDETPPESVEPSPRASTVGERFFASPIVRRIARERGLSLEGVSGTGPGGRIVRRDLDALPAGATQAKAAPGAATPTEQPSNAAGFTEVPLTGMRRAIARRLTESKSTVPHFYLVADCRVDRLVALRAEANATSPVKLSINDFVIKAAAAALIDVPQANATWAETAVRLYDTVDLSVAVAIDGGLVTPVLRSVEQQSLTEVARNVAELAGRAREGRLKQRELEGGSLAVSNLGMYGVTEFSAIINPPQAAILAVGAARQQAIVVDGALAVGTIMTVTLSADHRVLDGALAAQWLAAFVARIENPVGMLV